MDVFATMRRLHERGPGCRGLAVDADADGVMLGPDYALVERQATGYRAAASNEIASILRYVFGNEDDAERLTTQLAGIVRALDDGELAKAQILGLQIPVGTLSDRDLYRLDVAASLLKAGFDPAQRRDDHGQWSSESGQSATITPVQFPVPIAPPFPIPFPSPFRNSRPKPKADDTFPGTPPFVPPVAASQPRKESTQTGTGTATSDNEPKLCPPETPEAIGNRTFEQLDYQRQITGLEFGWDVTLNGVRYDGCRETDGVMLEAKTGSTWLLNVKEDQRPSLDGYEDIMDQAERQSLSADKRYVEWHFSDEQVAAYFRQEFAKEGLANIIVVYTRYEPTNGEVNRVVAGTPLHHGFQALWGLA